MVRRTSRARRCSALLAVVSVAVLAACGGDEPASGADETSGTSSGASDADDSEHSGDEVEAVVECLQGTWAEDMDNLLVQWQTWSPGGQGLPVTAVAGQNSLTVTADAMVYAVDSVVHTAMPAQGGVVMTGEGETSGSASFDYDVTSQTAVTVGPVTAQGVTSVTRVFIDGILSNETPLPWDGGIEGEAILWCEDDTLSLEPSVSGWIHVFTRAD